jgi:UDP-N-acetylglucosamine 2-epimerase (non-hydrolysing)
MRHFLPKVENSDILSRLALDRKGYILVTAHRSENVDNPEKLSMIIYALGEIAKSQNREVIYPMHPRTRSKLGSLEIPKGVRIMDPLGFYDFNKLLSEAWCILSDSGTASEEALFYKVPCVNLRMTTERPETVEAGGNIIAGLQAKNIIESVETAVTQEWGCRYDLNEGFTASSVVINAIRSDITNFF